MGQSRTTGDTGTHQAGTTRSADNSQQAAASFLSDCLTSDKGNMQLNIPGDILPQFLIEANSAVNANRLARAGELINTENIEVARRMATENPSHGDVIYLLLGVISQKLGQLSDALSWYEKILENQPNALVANEIATIYQKLGRYSKVIEYRQKAVQAEPDNIGIWSNYAVDLIVLGKPAEGIDLLRRAAERNPAHPSIHSNLLWYANYLPGHDAGQLFEDHKRWGQTHAPPYLARTSHANDPDPDRRLRIGYICPDFRGHPTSNTFEQFLRGHDRNVVEVYGYGNVARPDEFTAQLKRRFDHYSNVYGTADDALAEQIASDRIDTCWRWRANPPRYRSIMGESTRREWSRWTIASATGSSARHIFRSSSWKNSFACRADCTVSGRQTTRPLWRLCRPSAKDMLRLGPSMEP